MVGAVAAGLALEWVLLLGPRRRFNWLLPLGIAYVAVAGASLAWLRADPDAGRANLLLLVSIVWASDIGAYVTGRLAGGPRLAPAISPGKTWSGAIGGLLSAIAVGAVASLLLDQAGRLPVACLVAACLSIVGQCGDLLESWVKRRLGVKDSGRLIPGHGGLFDRLDALLAAAPAAALLALIAGRAVILWG
jgi:phosphatidate cytidylyltransferase